MVNNLILKLIVKTKVFSGWAPYLVKITGKSKEAIHPKHLLGNKQGIWFKKYLKQDYKVIDIGCGNGQFTLKAASCCRSIVGIDRNPIQLAIALREKKVLKLRNADFIIRDIETKLPFVTHSVDVIILLDVLEHINNRKALLRECHRLLKEGGLFILSVPNKNTSFKKRLKNAGLFYYADIDHKIEYSLMGIRKVLNKEHFDVIEEFPTVLDTPFIGFIDLIGGISLKLYSYITQWRKTEVSKYPDETTGFRLICRKGDSGTVE